VFSARTLCKRSEKSFRGQDRRKSKSVLKVIVEVKPFLHNPDDSWLPNRTSAALMNRHFSKLRVRLFEAFLLEIFLLRFPEAGIPAACRATVIASLRKVTKPIWLT
jgi:hypothetical protein